MPARCLAEQSEQEREADPGGRLENRHRHHEQGPDPVGAGAGRQDEAQGADQDGASSKRFACKRNSSAYRPPAVISSWCGPSSMIWPPSSTTTRSALRTVANRCEIATVVAPAVSSWNVS